MMKNITLSLLMAAIMPFALKAQTSTDNSDTLTIKEINLNEVTVRSFKETTQRLHNLPASVSSISPAVIENRQMSSLKDATALIPNFFMPDYGSKLTSPIYIRGIGSRINSPSVGLYVDGIPYFEKSTFDFEFADIERIEVLRGPQGTLYGRNTMGGLINVFTRQPSQQAHSKVTVTGGSYGLRGAQTGIYQPVSTNTTVSLTTFFKERDGYFENAHLGGKVDNETSYGAQLRIKQDLSQKIKLSLLTGIQQLDQGGYPYAQYNETTDIVSNIGYDHFSSYTRQMGSNAVVLDFISEKTVIKSATSHQFLSDKQDIDQDFTPSNLYVVVQEQKQQMISHELTQQNRHQQKINYTIGLFAFHQWIDNMVDLKLTLPNPAPYTKYYNNPTTGLAVFGEATANDLLTKGLSVTAGLRVDQEKAQLDYEHVDHKKDGDVVASSFNHQLHFNELIPKIAMRYQTLDIAMVYGTIAKGYKTGGFNTSFDSNNASTRTYKPERSVNYELGFKTNPDEKISMNFALFYIYLTDQQITQPMPSGVGTLTTNAGKSESKGVEIEIYSTPIKHLNIALTYGYNEARFTDYQRNATVNYRGNYVPMVPKSTLMVSGNYQIPVNNKYLQRINLNANYQGQGEIYWNEDNLVRQDFYGLVNGKLSLILKNIKIEGWGKNLAGTDYFAYYLRSLNKSYVQKGKPMHWGINLSVSL